ncbi:13467_t:CDS:2 [Acaulospora morrowiae]|uniref:13467_t:CDS:1 n=1 Tax=Acaulospora morrowiae TaxID=94023 RepID=A0A9N9G4H2_9GLOM|nr:13467_t:CDS:2 [Acaulospora morrowiae]
MQMDENERLFQWAITEYELNNIPIRNLKNKKRIGRGSFGNVYRCNIDGDSRSVAIKEMSVDEDSDTSIKSFLNELKLHSRAKNHRIIELFGMSYDKDEDLCYLVMELADWNLRKYLTNKKDELQWDEKIELAIQLTEGVSYIHNVMNVAHRDLNVREAPVIGTPLSFIQLYSKCWDASPLPRPTAAQILNELKSLSLDPIYNGDNFVNNELSNTSDRHNYSADIFEESFDDSMSSDLAKSDRK